MSNRSMNLWSESRALAAAKRWYSSNIEDRHHLCIFLRHPTRQPVRCWKNIYHFPRSAQILKLLEGRIGSKILPFLSCSEQALGGYGHLHCQEQRNSFTFNTMQIKTQLTDFKCMYHRTKDYFKGLTNRIFRDVYKRFLRECWLSVNGPMCSSNGMLGHSQWQLM